MEKLKIVWTKKARRVFNENAIYMSKNWSEKTVNEFSSKVFGNINLLSKFPNMGEFDENLNMRKLLVHPDLYLLYQVENEDLIIVSFFNNNQKPIA
ncbi:MAG: type II toxin-antitoxin system RelE/ParE family toxin [Flavobacteriales bacterium]